MYNKKEKVESIIPVAGHVAAAVEMPEDMVSKGGVIMTAHHKDKYSKGDNYNVRIVAVADDVTDIAVGDRYITNKLAGVNIPTHGKEFIKIIDKSMLMGTNPSNEAAKCKPYHERLLVRITSLSETTESGIIAPGSMSNPFEMDTLGGEVLAVADDVTAFKPGDVVRWEAHAGIDVDFSGEEKDLVMIPKYAVLAKIAQ